MIKLNTFQKISIWLAGFDQKTAEQCTSSEVRKMCILGTMVLIPALVAIFSYGYCFYLIFGSVEMGVLGGGVAAVVLLLIDRGIMAYGRPGSFSLGMFGRVLLAVLVGFLLAEPIILKIFDPSIKEQQYLDMEEGKKQAALPFDNEIKGLLSTLDPYKKKLDYLQREYTLEMDGTGGSGRANKGPIFEQKMRDYNNYKAWYDKKERFVQNKIRTINQKKKSKLLEIQTQVDGGLAGKVRALNKLGHSEPIVLWATWLLRIFFGLIELIPLMLKISPPGDRGLYYKLVDSFDKEREEVAIAGTEERKEIFVKEEQIRCALQFAELCQKEVQIFTDSKEKDTVYLMERVALMAEKKVEMKNRVTKNILDEVLAQKVFDQLDSIFDGFIQILMELIGRSNGNYSQNSI